MTERTPEPQETKQPGSAIRIPEIIGVSILAIVLFLPLIHLLLSGRALAGAVGLLSWLVALIFTVRFIRRGPYTLVWLPMLAILALFLIVRKFIE